MFALDMRITTRLAGAGARLFIAILVLLPTKGTNASSKRTALTAADFEKMLTSISNWGRWGKDDQLGALNVTLTSQDLQRIDQICLPGKTLVSYYYEDTSADFRPTQYRW